MARQTQRSLICAHPLLTNLQKASIAAARTLGAAALESGASQRYDCWLSVRVALLDIAVGVRS